MEKREELRQALPAIRELRGRFEDRFPPTEDEEPAATAEPPIPGDDDVAAR